MNENILVVDDEQNILDLCKDLLENEGFKVSTALNGVEAIKKMNKQFFSVFLIDIIMPGIDGLELMKKIKKLHPLSVIIITTGFSSVEGAVKAVHSGAFQYLSKPLNPDELIKTIKKGIQYSKFLYGPLQKTIQSVSTKKVEEIILLQNLDKKIKENFLNLAEKREFKKNEEINVSEISQKCILIITKGELSVWFNNTAIDYLKRFEIWGEEELIESESQFTDLRAETPVEFLYLNFTDVKKFLDNLDENNRTIFKRNLMRCVYYKWRKAAQRIVMLKYLNRE